MEGVSIIAPTPAAPTTAGVTRASISNQMERDAESQVQLPHHSGTLVSQLGGGVARETEWHTILYPVSTSSKVQLCL